MTPLALARKLSVMEEFPPLAASLDYGCQPGPTGVWYDSQRMHWLGYLQARQERGVRDASICYRRIQNVSMLIWLADVAKVPEA